MRIRRLMAAALGGVLLSCQGPAAVLAQEAAIEAVAGSHADRAWTLGKANRPAA
ncbi:hypothetical protein GGR12_000841 [Brevundimonas lenta]|uniref:Uncharacterized protein n=1 Tax=Brevundimonas lenta TaxID=424796 RepID=A0A7W6JD84_9CAUL|nr:hypothetical protein [Brevundimonas lenta]